VTDDPECQSVTWLCSANKSEWIKVLPLGDPRNIILDGIPEFPTDLIQNLPSKGTLTRSGKKTYNEGLRF